MPVNVPAGSGYRVYVFYRATVGGVPGASPAAQPGTVDVSAAIAAESDDAHRRSRSATAASTKDPDQTTYHYGTRSQLTATADPGWTFTGWSGDVANAGAASTTVTMDADKTVTATFTQDEYTLTVTPVGNGSVAKDPDQTTYHYGDEVQLTATADPGWTFTGWSGDLSGSDDPASVTITADTAVTATFEEYVPSPLGLDGASSSATGAANADSLSFSHTAGSGSDRLLLVGVSWNAGSATGREISSVTFDGTALTPVFTQQAGTQLRYSAIWALLDPPSGVTGTVAITFNGTVTNGIVAGAANFAGVDQTTPLGTPNGAGMDSNDDAATVTLTGLSGTELVFDNVFQGASAESQTLTASGGQAEQWNGWISNTRAAASTKQAISDSVTMSWTADSASYWAIAAVPIKPAHPGPTYDLTMEVGAGGGGTIDPTGTHPYAEGTEVAITATPEPGWTFTGWSGDVANAGAASTTVTMDADKTVTATFTQDEYTLDRHPGRQRQRRQGPRPDHLPLRRRGPADRDRRPRLDVHRLERRPERQRRPGERDHHR